MRRISGEKWGERQTVQLSISDAFGRGKIIASLPRGAAEIGVYRIAIDNY